jgi:hypothetical protein
MVIDGGYSVGMPVPGQAEDSPAPFRPELLGSRETSA